MKTFVKSIIILLASLLCASCVEHLGPGSINQEREAANLSFSFNLADFGMTAPQAGTRSEPGLYTEATDINSCAICIFKLDHIIPANSRVVGYRIFINPHTDGQRYFFRNIDPASYVDDFPTPSVLPDILLSSAGGAHALGLDDSTAEDSQWGLNGIAADGQSVTANFIHDSPLHGSVEQISTGDYVVVALVNFTEEPIVTIHKTLGYWIKEQIKYWQDHQAEGGFDGIVYEPIMSGSDLVFSGSKQILNARVRLYDSRIVSLASGQDPNSAIYTDSHGDVLKSTSYVHHSTTRLCATAIKEITAKSGYNSFPIALERLASRVTFKVHNQSSLPIAIENFTLSSNFAAAATYLFPMGDKEFNSPTWLGAPDTMAPHALVTFDPNASYAQDSEEVFFDALLAPGNDAIGNQSLSFNIKVGINDGNFRSATYIDEKRDFADFCFDLASPLWPTGEGKEYCIQTIRRSHFLHITGGVNKFVRSTDNSTSTSDLDVEITSVNNILDVASPTSEEQSYVWIIEKVSSNTVRIKSKARVADGQDPYLVALNNTTGGDVLGWGDQEGASVFSVSQYTHNSGMGSGTAESVAFTTSVGGVEVYVNEKTDNKRLITCSKWCDDGAHFYLYPIKQKTTHDISKSVSFPLKSYDALTGKTQEMHSLHRNDHLTVTVNVSYNQYTQDVDFIVDNWNEINNYIDFH